MKIATWFDKVWNWLVWSSANPDKISGTVKWGLTSVGTILTVIAGFGNIQFPTAAWTSLMDSVIQLTQIALVTVATLGTVVAGIRKVWLTVKPSPQA